MMVSVKKTPSRVLVEWGVVCARCEVRGETI